jgi:hypothetical protein
MTWTIPNPCRTPSSPACCITACTRQPVIRDHGQSRIPHPLSRPACRLASACQPGEFMMAQATLRAETPKTRPCQPRSSPSGFGCPYQEHFESPKLPPLSLSNS